MVADFNKKGNRENLENKSLFQTIGVIILIIIVVLIISDIKMYKKKRELDSQIISYQRQVEDLKKSSQKLKDEIANSDNKDYLEKLAYEQMDQQRPGETEYMFVKAQKKTDNTSNSENFWSAKSWFGWIGDFGNWIKSIF